MNRRTALLFGAGVAALFVAAGIAIVAGPGERQPGSALAPTPTPTRRPPLFSPQEARARAAAPAKAILQSAATGDFASLRAAMQSENAPTPEELKARFEPYRNSGPDWARAATLPATLAGPPTRDSRGRLILGVVVAQAVNPHVDLVVDLAFEHEGGDWKFADYTLGTRGNPDNKPALPGAEEINQLARATLALFAEGCAAKDFKPLLESMAEPSRRSLTPETLAENYDGWPERAPDAAKLREAEIALGAQPTLDERNLLAVDGMVVGDAKPKGGLRFSLRYFKEGESWKPLSIQIFPEEP